VDVVKPQAMCDAFKLSRIGRGAVDFEVPLYLSTI